MSDESNPIRCARFCVLSSSSRGNCSVVVLNEGEHERLVLIDAGLSPRRTAALLAEVGLRECSIEAIILTHLDIDHCHSGWVQRREEGMRLCIHKRHVGRAHRMGLLSQRTELFDRGFSLAPGVKVHSYLNAHDDLGTACFRITLEATGRTLGFATDLGRATDDFIAHLAGVDVLAIESNYCPVMQQQSARPRFLVDRIMGGRGHLSNAQSARAVREIAPREHLVLLHLSLECNHPETAAASHRGATCALTVARPDGPTGWIAWSLPHHQPRTRREAAPLVQPMLWPALETS